MGTPLIFRSFSVFGWTEQWPNFDHPVGDCTWRVRYEMDGFFGAIRFDQGESRYWKVRLQVGAVFSLGSFAVVIPHLERSSGNTDYGTAFNEPRIVRMSGIPEIWTRRARIRPHLRNRS